MHDGSTRDGDTPTNFVGRGDASLDALRSRLEQAAARALRAEATVAILREELRQTHEMLTQVEEKLKRERGCNNSTTP